MSNTSLNELIVAEVERLSRHAPVAVSVVDGVVTLTGEVPDAPTRLLIEQELLRRPEVSDVHNYLRVAPPPGDARAQLLALLEREGVRIPGVEIEAAGSKLVISGPAETWFERDAAERLAWSLPGVRAVVNRITLPASAVGPDAEAGENPIP